VQQFAGPGLSRLRPSRRRDSPLRTVTRQLGWLVPAGERVFVTYEGQGAGGKRFRNTEILTIRDGQICDVEVYFGWSIPHEAAPGGFVEAAAHG